LLNKFIGEIKLNHHKKLFLEIIEMMEERDWEYKVTFTHIQVELGNAFYNVPKDDLNKLFELKDEIMCW